MLKFTKIFFLRDLLGGPRLDEFKKSKRQQMKKMRNEDDETIPDRWKAHTACKRIKRMTEEEEETLDVSGWWRMAEVMSTRSWILTL